MKTVQLSGARRLARSVVCTRLPVRGRYHAGPPCVPPPPPPGAAAVTPPPPSPHLLPGPAGHHAAAPACRRRRDVPASGPCQRSGCRPRACGSASRWSCASARSRPTAARCRRPRDRARRRRASVGHHGGRRIRAPEREAAELRRPHRSRRRQRGRAATARRGDRGAQARENARGGARRRPAPRLSELLRTRFCVRKSPSSAAPTQARAGSSTSSRRVAV